MTKRMVAIYFPHVVTDWMLRRQPELKDIPFALSLTERGRRIVKAVNDVAKKKGVSVDMVVADAKAIVPELQVLDYLPEQAAKLLHAIAEWSIRYTPLVAVNTPDGLIFDASGCTHLWGGEAAYIKEIQQRFAAFGYTNHIAMADTIGAAWAAARFGNGCMIIPSHEQGKFLSFWSPLALRLEDTVIARLQKLGLHTIGSFMNMPNTALHRRFGASLIKRLHQALGKETEPVEYIRPFIPYQERLPSMEPIRTAAGIEIGLRTLLEMLCQRLNREHKGLRKCVLRCYRVDGIVQQIEIGTNQPTRNIKHLFKLFEHKIAQLAPGFGIELFVLEAAIVEDLEAAQDALWTLSHSNETAIAELVDRLSGRTGANSIHRYLPEEHYWPERSIRGTTSLTEKPSTSWNSQQPRPVYLLPKPEAIEVSVPIPDYPPMLFIYKGELHTIQKADGPERIEQEWWIQTGLYRDYYCVEDDRGRRYWLFRSGDYNDGMPKWFIHGFFA